MQKWKATGTVLLRKRCDLKKIQERRRLVADGVVVHRSTIQRTLHQEKKFIGRVMRKKPFLSVRHKKSCMRYGKAHMDKPEAFWKKILWSDETKIELFEEVCMAKKTH